MAKVFLADNLNHIWQKVCRASEYFCRVMTEHFDGGHHFNTDRQTADPCWPPLSISLISISLLSLSVCRVTFLVFHQLKYIAHITFWQRFPFACWFFVKFLVFLFLTLNSIACVFLFSGQLNWLPTRIKRYNLIKNKPKTKSYELKERKRECKTRLE